MVHFASKGDECGTVLVDGGILEYLFSLLVHKDICVQRYTYKLISYLVFHKKTKDVVLAENPDLLGSFMNTMINVSKLNLFNFLRYTADTLNLKQLVLK